MRVNCFRIVLFLMSAMVIGFHDAGAQTSLIEKALATLEQAPPVSPDCFDFVVIGDSNTLKPLEQSDVFRQSLREFGILRPAFAVHVGDIVLGGAAEGVPEQWDLFDEVYATCAVPFMLTPGNHDISDEATERIWLDRVGPTHYSFSYGNSFFIVLNSEEVNAVNCISDEQAVWLSEQLESSDSKNIFVFLHQPHFEQEGDPDIADASWEKHWANVADVLKGHPVKVVFSGHEHIYRDCGERDGIRYVITGGAFGYGSTAEAEGGFNHYLRVRVQGDNVNWAVIKPYSVLPETAVTSARIDELFNIRNKWIDAEELFVPLGAAVDQDIRIKISNPHVMPMESSLTWETRPGWRISPMETEYTVDHDSSTELAFHITAENPEDVRFPVPVFRTRYEQTDHGAPVDVEQALRLVPTVSAVRTKAGITLDGVLDEWAAAQVFPATYPVNFDAGDTADLKCDVRFMWDSDNLYLAVETQDNEHCQPFAGDIVWSADNVELFINDWSWGLSLTAGGPEVFLYWGVDVSAETVNTDVRLAVKRDGTKTVYEAAFPKSHLTPLELAPGNSFRYNQLMNDLDSPDGKRHWLELVPGAGSSGGHAPRVKVVLED